MAIVAGGIAVNLSILSNAGWGPGGLTLGAAGVAQADAAPQGSAPQNPKMTSPPTLRTTGGTQIATTQTTTTSPSTRHRPRTYTAPPIDSPPAPHQDGGEIRPDPSTTTTRGIPEDSTTSTTTTPTGGATQTFSPAAGVRISALATDDERVRLVVKFGHGWSGDTSGSGKDVVLHFRNTNWIIEWHAWVSDGKIKRSSKRTAIDD